MHDSIFAGLRQMLNGIPGVLDVIDLTGVNKPRVSLDATGEGPAVIRRKGTERTFLPVSGLSAETARLASDLNVLKKNLFSGLEAKKELASKVAEQEKIISTESAIIKHRLNTEFPDQVMHGELSLKLQDGDGGKIVLMADGFPVKDVVVDQDFGLIILDRIKTRSAAELVLEEAEESLRKLTERDAGDIQTLKALNGAFMKQLEKDHADIQEHVEAIVEEDGQLGIRMEREVDEVLEELPNEFKRMIILKHLAGVDELSPQVIAQFNLGALIEAINHVLPPKE